MQTCENCGHDYNEFTSGTPSSEHKCDDCADGDGAPIARKWHGKRHRFFLPVHSLSRKPKDTCPKCGSKDLDGWTAGGQEGFTCAQCGHDQTTDFDTSKRGEELW
mgnify:FL=1|tara:strand:+ start:1135 stop:1449 length:315 start_codon:yes stop_codon:yes gene_type:complete